MLDTSTFFKDLIVVELASVLAGPYVGMFFAEMGAKVIKIENKAVGGDVTRKWKLSAEDPNSSISAYYHSVNYAKEVHMLDLSMAEDKSKALQFIQEADIVISNYKADSAEKLGMSYEQLKKLKPELIYGSISAYGPNDPRPGFDAVMQAETGWMSMNGQSDGPPTKMPVALIDVLAGHQLKEGVLVALLHKSRTGEGCSIDVSLFDASISALCNQATNYLNVDEIPVRKGSAHPNIAPYGDTVMSKDNQWLMLGIGNDNQFQKLCQLLDRVEMAADPRFITNAYRVTNRVELMENLARSFKVYEADYIVAQSVKLKIPISLIQNLEQVFSDRKAQELILQQVEQDGSTSKRVKTAVFRSIK